MTRLVVFVAWTLLAVELFAQDLTGKWQSADQVSYPVAALARADVFLSIEVAPDGTFRGRWDEYSCQTDGRRQGATGISCAVAQSGGWVSGALDSGGGGGIEFEHLGRTNLSWRTSEGKLSIELYRFWLSPTEYLLYRASLTRTGTEPSTTSGSATGAGSANAFYREFHKDPDRAASRYKGKQITLEGKRGKLISMSSGGAAIHIADGLKSNALVLVFDDRRQMNDVNEGDLFRFRCTVADFNYSYVYMVDCSVVRN